jgi:hypothetical protein
LKSVIVREFQATEAYSSLDLIKAKYNISRLSEVEKGNVIVRINNNNNNNLKKAYKFFETVKCEI